VPRQACRRKQAAADRETIPPVDHVDHQRQLHLLLLGEFRDERVIYILRRPRGGYQSHRIGPCQRRALARRIDRCVMPRAQQIDALLGLAGLARVGGVHVEAIGAAVDLRGADLDQFEQAMLDRRCDLERHVEPSLHLGRRGGERIEALGHGRSPWVTET
jgi:hypothetical protein